MPCFPPRAHRSLSRVRLKFPNVDLRVDTQTMSAVSARVLAGTATLGVVSPMGLSPQLERRLLSQILLLPVAAPPHR